ncbi:hypothetical protein QW131_15675 [Roseibium salinum]|nr:hypothetical protein [Roseibium salinum]
MSAPFPWSVETVESRLEDALQQASGDPAAAAVFTRLLEHRARIQAGAAANADSPLAGALLSVKALFRCHRDHHDLGHEGSAGRPARTCRCAGNRPP